MVPESLNLERKPLREQSIETSLLPDGHVVLVSKQTDWAYTLTPIGALVWEFCDGSATVRAIISQVGDLLEGETDSDLSNNIDALVTELEDLGALDFTD